VIHKPNKSIGYYGATVAAPIFKTIAKKIFNDTPYQVNISKKDLEALSVKSKDVVPDVTGLPELEALERVKKSGLKIKIKGSGSVKSQSLKPGSLIHNKQQIILELS